MAHEYGALPAPVAVFAEEIRGAELDGVAASRQLLKPCPVFRDGVESVLRVAGRDVKQIVVDFV